MTVRQTGSCPACASTDWVRVPGRVGGYGAASIPTGRSIFSAVPLTRYVCLSCGFVESWVEDGEGLARIRRAYGRRDGR